MNTQLKHNMLQEAKYCLLPVVSPVRGVPEKVNQTEVLKLDVG